jgi:hypothetical protein
MESIQNNSGVAVLRFFIRWEEANDQRARRNETASKDTMIRLIETLFYNDCF